MVTLTEPKELSTILRPESTEPFVGNVATLNIEKSRQRRHNFEFRIRFYVKNNATVDLGRP